MPRSQNQKLKLLYLMKILLARSDEAHPISTSELIAALASAGIAAERKAIYDDIEALRLFGVDIVSVKGKTPGYFIAARDFELAELKLLVDAVQSSKFITRKKSDELIHKLEGLASVHQARLLQRQVYVAGRVKTMNESVYYNVDRIHSGIGGGREISFRYFDYTVEKSRRYRRDGARYVVSPWALTWNDENYYMIAFDAQADIIKHYRVDKMEDIRVLSSVRRGQDVFERFDTALYARRVFGMYGGEVRQVRIRFSNRFAGAALDRFGSDVALVPDGDAHFVVTAEVAVSPQFFSWIFGFGSEARILSPQPVVEQMKEQLALAAQLYDA